MEFKCRECGSERIAPNVRVATATAGGLLARLRARVCADCGYTELWTDDPMGLYLAQVRAVEPSPGAPAANIQCPSCGSVLAAAATSCEACGWSQEAPAS